MLTGASRTDVDEAGAVDKINSTFEVMKVGCCDCLDVPPLPLFWSHIAKSVAFEGSACSHQKGPLCVIIESNPMYVFIVPCVFIYVYALEF